MTRRIIPRLVTSAGGRGDARVAPPCPITLCVETFTLPYLTSAARRWPNAVTLWRTAGKSLDNATWLNLGNPTGSRTSFNSQPTYVVQATTARGEPYFVYLGDNWMLCPSRDSAGPALEGACYIWLPFRMRAGESELEMDYRWRWRPSDPFAPVPRDPNPICRGQGNGEACGAEKKKRKRRPKRKEHTRWVSSRRAASQQILLPPTLNATPGGTLTSGKGATVG